MLWWNEMSMMMADTRPGSRRRLFRWPRLPPSLLIPAVPVHYVDVAETPCVLGVTDSVMIGLASAAILPSASSPSPSRSAG